MDAGTAYRRNRWLVILVCLVAVGGAFGSPPTAEEDEALGLSAIVVGDDILYMGPDVVVPRCVSHELNTPGQGYYVSDSGYYVSDSVGGVVVGYPVTFASPTDGSVVTLASWTPTQVLERPRWGTTIKDLLQDTVGDGVVMIVVADDFGSNNYELPAGFHEVSDPMALKNIVDSNGLSHGALVLDHLNALISAAGAFNLVESDENTGMYMWGVNGGNPRLIVQGVELTPMNLDPSHSGEITTDDIVLNLANNLSTHLARLQADYGITISRVVFNFSWVLLPCPSIRAFLDAEPPFETMDEYLDALAISNNVDAGLKEEILKRLNWTAASNQLRQILTHSEYLNSWLDLVGIGLSDSTRVAFAAAAGNFALPYQMVPADWPLVVGAGTDHEQLYEPGYSNVADVVVPGEWFRLVNWRDGNNSPTQLSYAGTSFSTPLVAMFTALDLTQPEPRCNSADPSDAPGLIADGSAVTWRPAMDVELAEAASQCFYSYP